MTLEEAYEKRRQECLALERENRKLKKSIEQLAEGSYVDSEKAAHIRTINRLTQENQHLNNELDRYKGLWCRQVVVRENFNAIASDTAFELELTKKELQEYKEKCKVLEKRIDTILNTSARERAEYSSQIDALKEALLKEKVKSDTDSTNSSLPTSKTPIGKKKHIPNSRGKSDKKRGGQPGHEKHSLPPLSDDEITESEDHTLDSCPDCGSGSLSFLGKKNKDELDYEIRIIKKRHSFYNYLCNDCGHIVHSPIPMNLKESAQYGSNLQALALTLTNVGFVSFSRTQRIIEGLCEGALNPCEAYICKLQKRAAYALKSFVEEARLFCISSKLIHWDDTVIFINTKRACMRFYGNADVALFKAHEKKNRESVDDDAILAALPDDAIVMHDHVTMNYNDDFRFRNVECNQHLQRDLQKLIDITSFEWITELKDLISSTIHDRNIRIAQGFKRFDKPYIKAFNHRVDKILSDAKTRHPDTAGHYYESDHRAMISRLIKYRDNYFLWLSDFSIPVTNNLSERNLRATKVKQKISGQYLSVKNASFFADIRTYLQTCRLHNVSEYDALSRLTRGNPYTLWELLQ